MRVWILEFKMHVLTFKLKEVKQPIEKKNMKIKTKKNMARDDEDPQRRKKHMIRPPRRRKQTRMRIHM